MDVHKIIGQLGEVAEEMDAMDEKELHSVIVQAETAMKKVKEELEANKDYRIAKQAVSDLSQGKKDVDKYQKAKVQYSLYRLEEIGKLDPADRIRWEIESKKKKAEAKARAEKKAAKEAEEKARQELENTEEDGDEDEG